jgi:hypothetical protein
MCMTAIFFDCASVLRTQGVERDERGFEYDVRPHFGVTWELSLGMPLSSTFRPFRLQAQAHPNDYGTVMTHAAAPPVT